MINPAEENSPARGRTIRVLVVDDAPQWIAQLSDFLRKQPGFAVVGKAYDGWEAVERNVNLQPDLVLMDVNMPRLNGIDAARLMKRSTHIPRVILMSVGPSEHAALLVDTGDADGFCNKADLVRDLQPLVHRLFPEPQA
jgi:DNA-binding NarL/FixJ family response regulator